MNAGRITMAAMGGVCLLHCTILLVTEGFPAGGVSFWAAMCSFWIAAQSKEINP